MIDKTLIEKLAGENLDGDDMFLVGVRCTPDNSIEVTVDSDSRMTIDRCIVLSKAIEGSLDRDAEDFSLTVSSAGIGQPLSHPRQYAKVQGKPVEVLLKNGQKITGTLTDFDGQGLTLEYQTMEMVEGKKKKQPVTHNEAIVFGDIKSTKEVLTIK